MRTCPLCHDPVRARDLLSGRTSGMGVSWRMSEYRFRCAGCGQALRVSGTAVQAFLCAWLLPLPVAAWLGSVILPWGAGPLVPVLLWGVGYPLYWLRTVPARR